MEAKHEKKKIDKKRLVVMLNTIFCSGYTSYFILMMGICSSTEQETFSSLVLNIIMLNAKQIFTLNSVNSVRRLGIEFVFITYPRKESCLTL